MVNRPVMLVAGCLLLSGCSDSMPAAEAENFFVSGGGSGSVQVYETEWADVVAADADQARMAAVELRAAAAAVFSHFGVRPDRGCLRTLNTGPETSACPQGAAWETAWMAPDFSTPPLGDDGRPMRRHQRLVALGLQTDTPASRLAQQLASDGRRCRQDQARLKLATHLRHELAHKFFIDHVFPKTGAGFAYGGDAPDWLDEAAAMTADVPALRRSRQIRFMAMLEAGRAEPFADFVLLEYPSMPELRDMMSAATASNTPQVSISRVNPDDPAEIRILDFYAQAQVLADFLIARSGDRRVLLDLSDALRSEQPFERWLSARLDIRSMRELDDGVRAWAVAQDWPDQTEDQLVCGG